MLRDGDASDADHAKQGYTPLLLSTCTHRAQDSSTRYSSLLLISFLHLVIIMFLFYSQYAKTIRCKKTYLFILEFLFLSLCILSVSFKSIYI